VKWRFSVQAGGVEGSKLCLFSVIMPAKCVSSVSPRFHYRRVTFCFLPLAAILESLIIFFKYSFSIDFFVEHGIHEVWTHEVLITFRSPMLLNPYVFEDPQEFTMKMMEAPVMGSDSRSRW
jgi:hypothetical protein